MRATPLAFLALATLAACGSSVESDPGSGGSGSGDPFASASAGGGDGTGGEGSAVGSVVASATATSTTTTATTGGGGDCLASAAGSWVVAVSTQLGPRKPILFGAEVVVEGDHLVFSLTALGTPYRPPLEGEEIDVLAPVGAPITLTSDAIGPGGELRIATGEVRIVGAADPFSSNDLVATLTLVGTACAPAGDPVGSYCGTVEGQVTEPILLDLAADQNAFAFNVLAPGVVDCAGTPADPFP